MNDAVGYAVSGASPESLEHFETACDELRCFYRDPVATVDRALAASPELVMGYALKAWLHLLGTEPAGIHVARECHRAGAALPANDRERRHLEAVRLLAEGHWHAAGRALEDLSIAYPLDSLALQAGHRIDFFTGQTRMLRDRIARVSRVTQ